MASRAHGGVVSTTSRLVVLDPLCGHCVTLGKALELGKLRVLNDNIHVYWLSGKADPLGFAAGEKCPFPHCFEYVCKPTWIQPYLGLVGMGNTHHMAAHARFVPGSTFRSSVV